MFITWQLWRALRYPERQHPIFKMAFRAKQERKSSWVWRFLMFGIGWGVFIFFLVAPTLAMAFVLGSLVVIPALLLIFNGTALGLKWLQNINMSITATQKSHLFDLMSLTTQGTIGVCWLLASGCVHRNNWLRRINRVVTGMVFIVLVLLGIAFTTLLIDGVSGNSTIGDMGTNTLLRDVLFLAFLVIVFWLDHIQSILIAVLLGIGLPRINRESAFLLIVAPIAFLTLQVMSYLLIAVAYILLRIVVFGILGAGFGSVIVLNSLTMCTIFFYRESLISLLWYFVRQRYDALYPITLQERFNTITDIA